MSRIKEVLKNFKLTVNIVHKKNPNKSKLWISIDLLINMIIYPISFPDYRKCNYINLSKKEKKECISKKEYEKFINYVDQKKYTIIFVDKILFNEYFKDFIGRDYIDIRVVGEDGLKNFIKNKTSVFAKVKDDCGGHGIKKLYKEDFKDVKGLYNNLMKNKQYLIEDTIVQHDALNKINPNAVNNIRFATLVKDGKVYTLTRTLRLNTGSDAVISSNDIMVDIDQNGKLVSDAVDEMFDVHIVHPDTKAKIKGTILPYIREAEELVKEAALKIPEVRYVGWDVAITPSGPVIIEGNFYPSYGLTQFYLLHKDYPLKKRIKKILGDEYNNIK